MPPTSKSRRVCEYCGTIYTKREHYERHIRTHTREKPFNCNHCTSKFSRRDTLRRHVRACHSDAGSEGATADTSSAGMTHQERALSIDEVGDQDPALFQTGVELSPTTNVGGQHPPVTHLDPALFAPVSSDFFEWQWDPALNLNPSFSIEDLCTSDPNAANVCTPWISLRPPPFGAFEVQTEAPGLVDPPQQMHPHWFTEITRSKNPVPSMRSSRSQTPAMAQGEISRDALASSLKQRLPDTTLPGAGFLNRCIHTFTTRLWPVIPIIHLPTFQPARTNPLLLLSICSLGALADGSQQALHHAERLFEGVHKAILVSSSPGRFLDEHTLAVLQAAVIGQTFALLSGNAAHLLTAQAFHGTLCIAARRFHDLVFNTRPPPARGPPSTGDWREWIKVQSIIRLLNALYIHNGEVSAIVQQPAVLRTQPLSISVAAHDNLFLSKTAEEWVELQRNSPANSFASPSALSSYAKLSCFIGEISHARCAPSSVMREEQISQYQASLRLWFLESSECFKSDRLQRLSMLKLWHSCYLLLLCDINLMEKACGRDGTRLSDMERQELLAWMLTPRAKQCVAHAVLLCKLLDELRTFDVPAIHAARSLWHAGLVLAVYSSFAPAHLTTSAPNMVEIWPGIEELRQSELMPRGNYNIGEDEMTPAKCRTLAFTICTALRHLGPWPIAPHYASTLDQVLNILVESNE